MTEPRQKFMRFRFAYMDGRAFRHGDIVRIHLQAEKILFNMDPSPDAGGYVVRAR